MPAIRNLLIAFILALLPLIVEAAPTVTATSPLDGSTAVPDTTTVTAIFSEAMKPASITGNSVLLRFSEIKAIAAGSYHTVALKNDGTVVGWGRNDHVQSSGYPWLTGVIAIAAGYYHTAALKSDGTVEAWGDNSSGQINVPVGLSGVTAIAAGYYHTVALKNDGTVVGWGDNSSGQFNVPEGLTGVTAIAAGSAHTVALKSDGTVVGWGDNGSGQINVPAGLTGVTAIAAGSTHTVALKSDGTVVGWGNNSSGQINVPAGLTGVIALAAGSAHTVALKSDGTVVTWGDNSSGQIDVPEGLTGVTAIAAGYAHTVVLKNNGAVAAWGNDDYVQVTTPTGLTGVTAIATGWHHSLALKNDGTVVGWGFASNGQRAVAAGFGVTAIAAGMYHSVALKNDGTVVGWGDNSSGQINVPEGLTGVIAIAAGSDHTVALKNDGTVVAWGFNGKGQTTVPAGLTGVSAIAAGYYHTVALKSNGTVVAWGGNDIGQTTVPAGLTGVSAIAAGDFHTLALKNDGTLVAWGDDNYGQSTVPGGLTGVIGIAAGYSHTVALKSDGTLVAWGLSGYGQTSVPEGLTGVTAIAARSYHTLALKSDGTVVAWGLNSYGETKVPADRLWTAVVATVSYDPGNSTVTITPAAPLIHTTIYTATVTAGARNVAGTAVAADTSWSFTAIGTYNVHFAANTGGTVSGNASQTVKHGDSATAVAAIPNSGYHFVNWSGTNGFVTTTANPLTVANVTAAQDITANFANDPVVINDGATYANNLISSLLMTPPNGETMVRISNDPVKWNKWSVIANPMMWTLSSGEGLKTVFVQFKNPADPDSGTYTTYSDTIMLDSKVPTGTIKVNKGALYTNNRTVDLKITATDIASGVNKMCIKETSAVCFDAEFEPFTSSTEYSLTSLLDGKKTIYATLKDLAGNVSKPLKTGITLDTIVPTGSVLINKGAETTVKTSVSLKLTATKASEMQLSLDGGSTWGGWEKCVASKKVTLSATKEEKVVKVKFRDLAGNESPEYQDSIVLQ